MKLKKLMRKNLIRMTFLFIIFIAIFENFPIVLALEVDTNDNEMAYSVVVGDTKTIVWVFSDKPTPTAPISYTIQFDGELVDSGEIFGTTVYYTPSDNLEEGIYYAIIHGECRGREASDIVRYTVADPGAIAEDVVKQLIPGFEPYLFFGTCLLLGIVVMISYYTKFKKEP